MLHPPLLRALGTKRKLKLGSWVRPGLRALYAARGLRGTPLDPFGRAEVRRVERALVVEYRDAVQQALLRLDRRTSGVVADVAGLPDMVRGYEEIKLASVERFRTRAAQLLDQLGATAAPVSD
jgi:indolepyruvate ferredoxin oxidoreductase